MNLNVDSRKPKEKKKLFYIWLLLLLVWLLYIIIPAIFKNETRSIIFDPNDYSDYYYGGRWIYSSGAPLTEYPQIPTYLFGVNRLISDSFSPALQYGVFYTIFSLEMIAIFFFVIKIVMEMLPQKNKWLYWLLFLPPTLYYVLNRFDILPALLCLIAFQKAQKKQWVFASVMLAIATFTKWYPVLLFPGFFVYASIVENKLNWKMVIGFFLTSLVILLPTFLQGGLAAIIAPFQLQIGRSMQYVALPLLISSCLVNWSITPQFLQTLFRFLQVSSPFFSVFLQIDTQDKLIEYVILSVSLFMLFSSNNSPQWFLWLMPFLILTIKNWGDILFVIVYNIITYLFFPIVFNLYGNSSSPLKILAVLSYLMLAFLIVRSLKRISFVGRPIFFRFIKGQKALD